ncbi:hypothetical protein [Micromonospora sp. LOL_024]|uniref:hypothetical protein n=1 Tax=Micromonospora sp. LOL_024 TaxID=3345412 RepID=UPI003A89A87B
MRPRPAVQEGSATGGAPKQQQHDDEQRDAVDDQQRRPNRIDAVDVGGGRPVSGRPETRIWTADGATVTTAPSAGTTETTLNGESVDDAKSTWATKARSATSAATTTAEPA